MVVISKFVLLAFAATSVAVDGLNAKASILGKYWGTLWSSESDRAKDLTPWNTITNKDEFGMIYAPRVLDWDYTEQSPNLFSYYTSDSWVQKFLNNGQKIRCGKLVWENPSLPAWVTYSNKDNATLIQQMTNHIKNVVSHFKGKCYSWDVVDNALDDNGNFAQNYFYRIIGPSYIALAFKAAAAADPSAKLYYNDYGIGAQGPKATGIQRMIVMLKLYGAKIDGIGMQSRFNSSINVPSTAALTSVMTQYSNLGVEMALTDLDIRLITPATPARRQVQAFEYGNVTAACAKTAKCVGISTHGWTDRYEPNWQGIPLVGGPSGTEPLVWDTNLVKKPAYNSILNAWIM